jgi:hypothetical protein
LESLSFDFDLDFEEDFDKLDFFEIIDLLPLLPLLSFYFFDFLFDELFGIFFFF